MGARSQMILGRAWTVAARCSAWGALVALAACGGGGGGGGGGGTTASYTLGGMISGLGSNSGLVLANGGTTLSVAAGATSFTFASPLTAGTTYSVTVQTSPTGMGCTVSSGGSGTINANVTSVDVTCAALSYTLGGTVTINAPGGVSDQGMVLTNSSNGDTYTFAANATSFTMPKSVSFGSAYAVAVTTQPTGLGCTVTNGTGSMPANNLTTLAVSCSALTNKVGGTITGLGPTTGLVLTNEGGDATTVPANATTFNMNTAVQYGAAYSIAVKATPTNLACTVTNGAGTMPATAVTDVQLACAAGTFSVLHTFGATGDGASPNGNLIQGADGSLYGMTSSGGANGKGAIFKITPAGAETVLYSFGSSASDGASPFGTLMQGTDGNLYGLTSVGGANSEGTVFKVTPAGAETVLYSFGSAAGDGAYPYGNLIQASDGNFYGLTEGGGTGYGTVFEITSAGVETVLHSFSGSAGDGADPYGSLIQGGDGNLYGMTALGGANGLGMVFKTTLTGFPFAIFHSFGAAGDGSQPYGTLVQASDGNLYGETTLGGANGLGTVFQITMAGAETVLHSFGGAGDGTKPYGNLIQASDGNLYGMTSSDPSYAEGVVFEVTTAGTETVLYSFGSSGSTANGETPKSSLVQASNGILYGLTAAGGTNNVGVVFEID